MCRTRCQCQPRFFLVDCGHRGRLGYAPAKQHELRTVGVAQVLLASRNHDTIGLDTHNMTGYIMYSPVG